MSRLDELIAELCPDGVKYKNLEDCCTVLDRKRKPITKAARESGEYPYYGANGIQDYVADYIFDGTFILVGEDGSVITPTGRPVVNWAEGKIWVNNHAHIVSEKKGVLLRFLYHFIQTVDVTTYIHGNIPKFTGGDFKAVQVPVPPLEVQREIVRILDTFTELSTELSTELTARKKQYEYYLDQFYGKTYDEMLLLGKKDRYKILPLAEIGNIIRGKRFVKADSEGLTDGVPCIHYGELYTHYGVSAQKSKSFVPYELAKKLRFAHKNDVVIVGAGENNIDIGVGVAWFGDDVAVHDACYILKHNLNPKYISYYLRTSIYHKQIKKYVSEGKICSISAQGLK